MANPMDISIATMVDKDLKSCATTAALSACETTAPELRQAFMQLSQDGIRRQEQLGRMMSNKGWYVAPPSDQATVNQLAPQLQAATQGIGGTFAPGVTPNQQNPQMPVV